jgi:hypothetical protein
LAAGSKFRDEVHVLVRLYLVLYAGSTITTGGSYGQEKVSQLSTCPRQPSCHAPSMPSRAAQRILAQQQSQRRARVLLAGFLGLATSYAAVAAYTLRLRTIDDTPELKAAKEKIKLARQEARQQQQQ